ncbi:DUF4293 domain-containing protein [Draconibacterium halophilum]|uniref:DUF4293 domain-containing protein n=1 Tax=Draconibacterium halophilum TaxID=2706887 RepID=A0A6C0RGP6_9BACT|nr:DUF4293 domain-containing protein [Draconibacterium halophilum]QIA08703.1 DUF4293 domain-containing protein [Draconibacterium halophilum]
MIQRIQTLFILVAGMLIGSLYIQKFADIIVNDQLHVFNAFGIFKDEELLFSGLPLMILIGIIAVLHLVTIFLYKKRILQIRILGFSMILMLGLFGLFFYFTYASFDEVKVAFKVAVALPIVAIILDWLAIRAIGKDEALVRSLDRIR